MPVNEMNVAVDRFVEKLENTMSQMLPRHGGEGVGEVLDEGEDHARASREEDCSVQPILMYF